MMDMRIDVEKELAACVRGSGGVVLADELPDNPTFPNADYWFPKDNVVAELKCLSEDPIDEDFKKRNSRLYTSWVAKGWVPALPAGRTTINSRDLPIQCYRELTEPIKKAFAASTIKKAGKQLKETKKYLNAPHAKGLLILVNDGNTLFTPEMTAHLLARILKGGHSSINSVIYFSVNESIIGPGLDEPSRFWAEFVVPDRVPIANTFHEAIRTAWMAHLSSVVPGPVAERLGPENVAISEMRFARSAGA